MTQKTPLQVCHQSRVNCKRLVYKVYFLVCLADETREGQTKSTRSIRSDSRDLHLYHPRQKVTLSLLLPPALAGVGHSYCTSQADAFNVSAESANNAERMSLRLRTSCQVGQAMHARAF